MSQKTNEPGLLFCSSPVPRLCPVPPWPCQQSRGLCLATPHMCRSVCVQLGSHECAVPRY